MTTNDEQSVALSIAFSLRRIADSLEKIERHDRRHHRRLLDAVASIRWDLPYLWKSALGKDEADPDSDDDPRSYDTP